jgi:hypothetical protein
METTIALQTGDGRWMARVDLIIGQASWMVDGRPLPMWACGTEGLFRRQLRWRAEADRVIDVRGCHVLPAS